jgi:3-oxoacyl-[acyl-carrier-protein] synthase-1
VVVTGVGACTCLGGAIEGAAAARAGIRRAAEMEAFSYIDESTNDKVPLVAHAIKGVTDGFQGAGRLIRMGILGLEDLLAAAPRLKPQQTSLFLALPLLEPIAVEGASADAPPPPPAPVARPPDQLVAAMLAGGPLEAMAERPRVFTEGRHGALLALQAARAALRERRCESALVGACDTELDEERLARSLAAGRLKTETNPVGFMPGEASAFLLLERQSGSGARGDAGPALVIDEPQLGFEQDSYASERPAVGRALADVAAAALAGLGDAGARAGNVFIDINGEPYRSADWGHAIVRLRAQGLLNDWSDEVSVLSFGEIGAASPVLALVLAARAFARGYARGDTALVLSSDDGGNRGAATLRQERSGAR